MADPLLAPGIDLAYISGEVPGTITDPAYGRTGPGSVPAAKALPANRNSLYLLGGVLALGLVLMLTDRR